MGRTILAVFFLAGLGAAIWFGVRWLETRDDLEATIIFDEADELVAGNHVVAGSLVIGEITAITPLQGKDAVSVRVESGHRDEMRIDSRFAIGGRRPGARVEVASTFSFGRPVRDGEVLYARPSAIAGWIEEKGAPLVARIRDEAARLAGVEDLRGRLDEWTRELPEWKRAGDEVFQDNLQSIADRIDEMERKLRAAGKDVDADRLRRDFESWLARVKARWSDSGDGDQDEP
ncbi:MAG TPA: hypothetical protein VMS56_10590 [Thermoanaerobaculia bacterium]|nr:hypothetical protein [Thermoanaerobaculia bacterium]